jgi:DNA-binding MarR family transcriptional regulator
MPRSVRTVAFENVDPLTAQVLQALGKVVHLNRLITIKMAARHGIQPPEGFALTFLGRNEGISQRDLAEMLHLSPPRVSAILQTLEERGALVRRADEVDRRLARVFLTDEGRRQEKEQRGVLGEYVARTLGAFSEADRRDLARLLGKLGDRLLAVLQEEQGAGPRREGAKTP